MDKFSLSEVHARFVTFQTPMLQKFYDFEEFVKISALNRLLKEEMNESMNSIGVVPHLWPRSLRRDVTLSQSHVSVLNSSAITKSPPGVILLQMEIIFPFESSPLLFVHVFQYYGLNTLVVMLHQMIMAI